MLMMTLSEDLSSKKRFSESARVLLDYGNDFREAVISLVQGNHFPEARRIVRRFFYAEIMHMIRFC
jgi:hypothetical protein